MLGFLLVFGGIAAVLFVFLKLIRFRVRQRMDAVEMPAELVAAQRAVAARAPAGQARPGMAAAAAASVVSPRTQAAPHFMLIYEVGPDFIQRRAQYRDEHLALAWKASESGELVLAGALEEPAEQAFLLFRGSREAALRFAAADPYVKHGLVRGFRVRQWMTVVGVNAAQPTRPK